jgi:hypothetical protein
LPRGTALLPEIRADVRHTHPGRTPRRPDRSSPAGIHAYPAAAGRCFSRASGCGAGASDVGRNEACRHAARTSAYRLARAGCLARASARTPPCQPVGDTWPMRAHPHVIVPQTPTACRSATLKLDAGNGLSPACAMHRGSPGAPPLSATWGAPIRPPAWALHAALRAVMSNSDESAPDPAQDGAQPAGKALPRRRFAPVDRQVTDLDSVFAGIDNCSYQHHKERLRSALDVFTDSAAGTVAVGPVPQTPWPAPVGPTTDDSRPGSPAACREALLIREGAR